MPARFLPAPRSRTRGTSFCPSLRFLGWRRGNSLRSRRFGKIDSFASSLDFRDECCVAPPTSRLRSGNVNRPLALRAGNRDRQVRVSGRPVDVSVSRQKHSIVDWRSQSLDDFRIGSGFGEGIFVDIGRFQCPENNYHEQSNAAGQQKGEAQTTGRHKPFPVPPPPGFSRQ